MKQSKAANARCGKAARRGRPGRTSGHRETIEVAAGLVFREGKLLITQRRPDDHLGGLWEFPGGKRERGETFVQCLKRELMEELGIEIQPRELLEEITHRYPEKTVHLKFFRCAWQRHEPRTLGCHALAWVDRHQLGRFLFPAADAQLLRKLKARPSFWRTQKIGGLMHKAAKGGLRT